MTFLQRLSDILSTPFSSIETTSQAIEKRVVEDDPGPIIETTGLLPAINVRDWKKDWDNRYEIMAHLCEHFGDESLEDELACLKSIATQQKDDPWFARQLQLDPIAQLINFINIYKVSPSMVIQDPSP